MKKIIIASILAIGFIFTSFTVKDAAKKVKISVQLQNCEATDSIFLYQFEGFGFSKVHIASKKGSHYEFKLPQAQAQFYFLGKNTNQLKPIIVGTESDIKIKGTCNDMAKVIVE